MKDNFEPGAPPPRKPEQERKNDYSAADIPQPQAARTPALPNGSNSNNPLNFWMLIDLEAQRAVELANLYISEAVEFTRQVQKQQAELVANDYLKEQVAHMDKDIADLRDTFRGVPLSPQVNSKLGEMDRHLGSIRQNLTN